VVNVFSTAEVTNGVTTAVVTANRRSSLAAMNASIWTKIPKIAAAATNLAIPGKYASKENASDPRIFAAEFAAEKDLSHLVPVEALT